MDTSLNYRSEIERILIDYAQIPYSHGNIQIQTIFDRERDHYLLMLVGRDGVRRIHGCLIHVDIVDEQIVIQRDGTERGVARELIDVGVPRHDIILAFRAPNLPQTAETVE